MDKKLKPYVLTWIRVDCDSAEGGCYRFIGELMGFPLPPTPAFQSGSIMVRRVPGHPGTLDEIALDNIEGEPNKKPRFVHYATVKGSGQFPVDMLRYDSCAPVNFKLEFDSWGKRTRAVLTDPKLCDELIVADVSSDRRPHWTSARWSSFLWGIKELKTEALQSN